MAKKYEISTDSAHIAFARVVRRFKELNPSIDTMSVEFEDGSRLKLTIKSPKMPNGITTKIMKTTEGHARRQR